MVGVFPKTIIRIAFEGSILCSTKVTRENSLRAILNLQVRSILESDPILGLPRGLQYPYYRGANQADVCYCINHQVDKGVNMGMYNGLQSTWHFNPFELRRESIRNVFWGNMNKKTTITIGAGVMSNGRVSLKDTVFRNSSQSRPTVIQT